MKIGIVSSPLTAPGGVKEHALALANYLRRQGHTVKVIAPPAKDHFEKSNNETIIIGRSLPLVANASCGYLGISLKPGEVREMLEREHFDLIHYHGGGFLEFQIAEHSSAVNILTLHANPEGSTVLASFPFLLDMAKAWAKDKVHGLVAVSPVAASLWSNFSGPFQIIPNGVDLHRFNPQAAKIEKYLDGKINILFVGRFDKRKGLALLISAFGRLRKERENVRLIVVGDGEEGERCYALVRDNKIPDVVFAGFIADEQLPSYYGTADIFCSPATHAESFGIVLLEAMATGKPVVAFANSGYREVLIGPAAEFLVPAGDVHQLEETLKRLVDNENLRRRLGEWGIREAEKYSWEKVGGRILRFYGEVMSAANGR